MRRAKYLTEFPSGASTSGLFIVRSLYDSADFAPPLGFESGRTGLCYRTG